LLPKYRGSSPIQWAIINGEKRTGITILQTDVGLDTGDIILTMPLDIAEQETAGELFGRLAALGAVALDAALDQIEKGTVRRTPQNNMQASVFPMLRRETGRIRFTQTAFEINNLVRGLNPWPVAYFTHAGTDTRVFRAMPLKLEAARKLDFLKVPPNAKLGSVIHASSAHGLFVMCKDSVLRLDVIQIPGGKALSTRDFLNGRSIAVGTVFL
jgi:methionyl-tRNA formyltransferase